MKISRSLSSILLCTFVLGCSEKDRTLKQQSTGESFDLNDFSHAEEPYLTMTRTVQLLNMEQIVGWSLAHIKSGDYEVYVESGKRLQFLDGRSIKPSDSLYLFLKYAQKGDEIRLYSLTNTNSVSAGLISDYKSSGKFNLDPIPSKDGRYVLCETYDNSGRIVLYLKNTKGAIGQPPKLPESKLEDGEKPPN